MSLSYRIRDVFEHQKSSGTSGQTFAVMMDISSWTGKAYIVCCLLVNV